MNLTKEKHATHTPGPWHARGTAISIWNPFATAYKVVATVEQEKDARLIAAAPAMYEMCKLFEECMETIDGKDGYDASYELAKVREVLAKVEGGEG